MSIDILITPSGILKLCEIGLSLIVVSVTQGVEYFVYQSEARAIFCGGVLVMGLVVTPLLLVIFLSGHAKEIQRTPFEMLFNMVMAVFMISAGGVIFKDAFDIGDSASLPGQDMFSKGADAGKAAGTFAIINGVLYGIDSFFAQKNMQE